MVHTYDAIIVGTGQAGPSLAGALADAGKRVAVVERRRFGGTCVNTGCIPTKALVASARAAHMARRARDFGVMVEGAIDVDMRAVRARKDEIVRPSREGLERWLRDADRITVHAGHARFEAPHTIRVGEDRLEADQIFLNVGARSAAPPLPGLDAVDALDNSRMVDLDVLPEHLVIVGGSYIGLEFAQMYRRFGSRVTVIERADRLISHEDPDVSDAVRDILEAEGVTVRLGAECMRVERSDDGIAVSVTCTAGAPAVVGSHLLLAVGRRPNTDDLGAHEAGLQLNDRGYVVVDDELRTSVEGVWALGDCNGRGAFTHTAYNDFEIVSGNLLRGEGRTVRDRITTYGLFVDPPLGRAGMTEAEARKSGRRVLVGKRPMAKVGRAFEKSETRGFMKVLVDADTHEILGAAILGVGGDEVVHVLLDAMYARAPYTTVRRAMHIHPTVAELVPTMLGDLQPLD
jgi:pyruvate/2-oxoglutarate dehydrogenase complex dihydrolipoamide dehydrogenase (E3) component